MNPSPRNLSAFRDAEEVSQGVGKAEQDPEGNRTEDHPWEEHAPSGPEPAQTGTLLPAKISWKVKALGLFFGLFIMLVLIRSSSMAVAETLGFGWINSSLAAAQTVFLVAVFWFTGWLVYDEAATYLKFSNVLELREEFEKVSTSDARPAELKDKVEPYLERIAETHSGKHAEALTELRRRMHQIAEPGEWKGDMEHFLLDDMDREARMIIISEAAGIGIATAVCPRGIIDVAVVLWRSVRMIGKIAQVYGGRAGRYGTLRMSRRVIISAMMAGSAENLSDLLPAGAMSALGSAGQCMLNALMACQLGKEAVRQCRPIPLAADQEPLKGAGREVFRTVLEKVRGKEQGKEDV